MQESTHSRALGIPTTQKGTLGATLTGDCPTSGIMVAFEWLSPKCGEVLFPVTRKINQ